MPLAQIEHDNPRAGAAAADADAASRDDDARPTLAAAPSATDWCARKDVADDIAAALAGAGTTRGDVRGADGARSDQAAAIAQRLRAAGATSARSRACKDALTARAALAIGGPKAAQQAADAALLLASVEGVLGEIAPSLRALLVAALVEAGRPDEALAAIDEAKDGGVGPLDSLVLRALKLAEADALVARGRAIEAIAVLQALADDRSPLRDTPAVLARIVAASEAVAARAKSGARGAGRAAEEATREAIDAARAAGDAARRELLRAHPGSDEARALEPLLDASLAQVPGASTTDAGTDARALRLSIRDQTARLEALLRTGRADRAAREARAYVPPPGSSFADVAAFEVQAATALVRGGAVDEALRRTARAAADPAAPDEVKKVHAWALGKARRIVESAEQYARLAASTTDPARRAEACFYAAFELYEADERARAEERFAACAETLQGTAWAPQAAWYRGLLAILDGDWARAERHLGPLAAQPDREQTKHRYWLARAKQARGDAAGARAILEALAREEPTEWYGLLARARLGAAPPRGATVLPDALLRFAADDEGARRARLLRALGFDDEARAAVRARPGKLADVALAQAIDDPHVGFRRGPALLPSPPVRGGALVARSGWRGSYASPWRAVVDAHCAAQGVPSSFAYAIMRTESGFDPRAVSVAGARGLLQLMPAVARKAAKLVGRDDAFAARLFDPAVVVQLGCFVLGTHVRELGSRMMAAAAYNGSPDAATSWMRRFGHLEPELFVERVPFRETRDYIKRVLSVAAVYRALDGAPLALELPAKVGPPPAAFTTFPPWTDAPQATRRP